MRAFTLRATVVIVGTLVATITIVHSLVYLSIDRSILSVEMPGQFQELSCKYPREFRPSYTETNQDWAVGRQTSPALISLSERSPACPDRLKNLGGGNNQSSGRDVQGWVSGACLFGASLITCYFSSNFVSRRRQKRLSECFLKGA
jgi:hypothetical protein